MILSVGAARTNRPRRRPAELSLGIRLTALVLLACFAMVAVAGIEAFHLRATRFSERERAVRSVVETALGVITYYGDQEASGATGRGQAQQTALALLKTLRYGNGNYFWISTYDEVLVMHPIDAGLEGTDVATVRAADGVPLLHRFVTVATTSGSGYVHYAWPKPETDKPQPKIGYVIGYRPWGWIIGSGAYVDDIDAAVASDLADLGTHLLLVLLAVAPVVLALRRSIARPIQTMTRTLEARRLQEAVWRHKAHTDPLTGLANRAGAVAALHQRLATAGPEDLFAVIMCDLDGFKQINDAYGHAAGDEVLREIAHRLRGLVRPGDTACRLGGDEFLVIVDHITSADALKREADIRSALDKPVHLHHPNRTDTPLLPLGVSTGLRVATSGEDPAVVLHDADMAMYAHKRHRKALADPADSPR